jgi:hypothetical protein
MKFDANTLRGMFKLHRGRGARLEQILDLFGEDSRRNV